MISAGDRLAFGTVPKAGTHGGVLGLLDPATGRSVIKRDIVPGHSILGLAYRDGVVYGATSAFGGTSTPAGEAAAFAYDIATDSVLWRTTPVAGDLALGSITFDGAGRLWGLSPDTLFELDPATGRTVRAVQHQSYPWSTATQVWLDTHLVFHQGFLWGKVQSKAYRIDPATMAFARIVHPVSNLALGPDGHLYLSRYENFYTYRICA
ncbi:hypothetical protein ACFQ0B_58660 [Nonomuraea thailandensis]